MRQIQVLFKRTNLGNAQDSGNEAFAPGAAPCGAMVCNPIVSRGAKADIATGAFRKKPLVPENFFPLGKSFAKKARLPGNQLGNALRERAGSRRSFFSGSERIHGNANEALKMSKSRKFTTLISGASEYSRQGFRGNAFVKFLLIQKNVPVVLRAHSRLVFGRGAAAIVAGP